MVDFMIKICESDDLKNSTVNLILEINIGFYLIMIPVLFFLTISLHCLENTNMLHTLFL